MNLKIREANMKDYIELNALVAEVHKLHVKNRPDVYVDVDIPLGEDYLQKLLNASDTKLFVVENMSNKELLAYSIVRIMANRNIQILIPMTFAYIEDFCVKASEKKKGIGKLLFEYVKDYAKSQGALSLQLTVWEFNNNAIKFYEAMGMSTRNRRMELNL